jgi:proteasome lid subunit RPN8/RPN11
MDIFLEQEAFLGLIVSAIETYKKECFGSLLGYDTRNRKIIELALPSQVAERTYRGVEPDWKRLSQSKEILKQLSTLEHLGYFHSHAQYDKKRSDTKLSSPDKESTKKTDIEIIVSINDKKRTQKWKIVKKELHGTISKYQIYIARYHKNKTGNIKKIPMYSPLATGLPMPERYPF